MTPQLEGTCMVAPYPALDTFESEFVLADFLHEMDELDHVQGVESKCGDFKRQHGTTVEAEPELKKAKISPTMPQVTPKVQPRKRRSTSWLRRKQELTALRSESEALETHVTFLKIQQTAKLCQPQPAVLTADQEMWKSVAAIARQECQVAQNENARLKNELEMYTRASNTLQLQTVQANLQQQELLDSKSGFVNAVRVGIVMSRHLNIENSDIFNRLESRMGARLHELDTVIREALQPIKGGISEQIQICRENGMEATAAVEYKHARLLPFGQNVTANTIWEIIELGGLTTSQHFHVTKQSQDVVGMASRFTIPLDRASSSTVSVDVHAVVKRFLAPAGMVVLVESHSEWSMNHPTAPAWKQTTEEAGWVVVNGHPLQADGIQRACQLRTTMKLVPETSSSSKAPTTFTGCVGDVVIPSFREIMSSHHQSIENFLLDSSRSIRA
ncbi:hypothetical protein PR001_g20579 [Phytophthora rubi]|uniref:START domain-containing protein n=1 Tax=Phytophthora rubi TaxID=129364 RepID=A0A6A3JF05_9STRA|nr:hypothetical protein PR001_g20579 [Phytophthora rubi]